MSPRSLPPLAALAIAAALASRAPAQEKNVTVDAKIEAAKDGGSQLALKGSAKKMPDQTRLIAKLLVKGQPGELGFWQIDVKNGAYDRLIGFEGKTAAPLVYKLELWLMVSQQLAPIQKWFQRELGVTDTHTEVLESAEVAVGTEDERKRFTASTLRLFKEVLEKAVQEHAKIDAAIQETPKDWPKAKKELNGRLRALQVRYQSELEKYLTLGEAQDLGLCQRVVEDAAAAISAIGRDQDEARRWMEQARQNAERLGAELSERLDAKKPEKSPEPPGEKKPGEKKEGG